MKWPPFGPGATVAEVIVFKGTSAQGQPNCSGTACAFIGVELRGFPPQTQMRCAFDSSAGPSFFRRWTQVRVHLSDDLVRD